MAHSKSPREQAIERGQARSWGLLALIDACEIMHMGVSSSSGQGLFLQAIQQTRVAYLDPRGRKQGLQHPRFSVHTSHLQRAPESLSTAVDIPPMRDQLLSDFEVSKGAGNMQSSSHVVFILVWVHGCSQLPSNPRSVNPRYRIETDIIIWP